MRLYKSKASVKVYHSSLSGGLTKFKAPNKPGDLWTVFEFNNSSGVTRIRTVGSETSSANVDSHGSSVTDGIGLMGGAIQGRELSLSTAVTTLAGSTAGFRDNAIGTSAEFYGPMGITTDGTNLYVADRDNHRIRKIVIDNGTVTTLAGTASACDSSTSNCDNATGTSAGFNSPWGITTDGTNLYVADTGNDRIRKIVISTGVVTTLAGSSEGSRDNATGTLAQFKNPQGITTDGTNLYVADTSNYRIRKIVIDNGTVTTLAGSTNGFLDNATGTSAQFNLPYEITTDGTNLYVADTYNHRIRKIVISTGVVTTLAGSTAGFRDNATGTLAKFNVPIGITTDGTNLYVADYTYHRIRKIVIDNGTVTTLAGTGSTCSSNCDNATGTSAGFKRPWGITTDGTNLYVTGFSSTRIRKIE
jgi:sugar lactone lactonase YvrE